MFKEIPIDQAKVARECLKSLTSEDLMQIAQSQHAQIINENERIYSRFDLNGNQLENEIAKILSRYNKEGRSQQQSNYDQNYNSDKKQVRFDEQGVNGNRI